MRSIAYDSFIRAFACDYFIISFSKDYFIRAFDMRNEEPVLSKMAGGI